MVYRGIKIMGKSLNAIINKENTRETLGRNPDLLDREVTVWHLVCACVCHYHTRGPYLDASGIIVLHNYFDKIAEGLSETIGEAYTIGLFYQCIARYGHIARMDEYANAILYIRFNKEPLRFQPRNEYNELPYPYNEL